MRKYIIILTVAALIVSGMTFAAIAQEEAPEKPQTPAQEAAPSKEQPKAKPTLAFGGGLGIEGRFALPEVIADLPLGKNFLRVGVGLAPFYEGSPIEGMASGSVISCIGIYYPQDLYRELLGFGINIGGGLSGAMVSLQSSGRAEGITYFPLALTVRATTDLTLVLSMKPYKGYSLWFEAGLNIQLGKIFFGPSIGAGFWF